ncbi:hypothetical protein [Burkholderia territorii]|uniref:hypothetical protein n=1 Tax=Burkholderia territorii TaxID=1503055 RepID=UPI00075243FD|nr:hypothetical protein [Burkholderia territorii]KWA08767.1 hypothetical protein WT37_24805 [Burkholderia territorii]
MVTRVLHSKIPHNLRVPAKKKAARDAVTPSVRGITLRKITGSGPIADALRKVQKVTIGLDAITTAQKLADATGDSELSQLLERFSSPEFMSTLGAMLKNLQQEADAILRNQAANPGADDLFSTRPTEGDPNVTAGLIGDSRVQWHAMDHETRLQAEQAAKKAAALRSTMALDTEQNKVRAQFGLDAVPVDADTLYGLFGRESKRSDV